MGAGADTLFVHDADVTFHVGGGDGDDRVFVRDEPKDVKDAYVLDNTTGTLEVDGTQTFSWTSFEEFIVDLLKLPGTPAPGTRFRFLGAATAETLDVAANPYSDSPLAGFLDVDLDLGGGEDQLSVNGTADGVIDMGDGHDVLTVADVDSVDADLAAGTIDIVRHKDVGTRHFGVAGIEDLTCSAYVSDNCERP
jgi:hypothetical protein